MSWIKRIEAILNVLKGSNINELELSEGETEVTIRRAPGIVVAPSQPARGQQIDTATSTSKPLLDVVSPLTGVYYASPSPTAEPFVREGDTIKAGQTIALIEAMKVFSEVSSEVAGRVVAIKRNKGDVVKKGDVLLQVEA